MSEADGGTFVFLFLLAATLMVLVSLCVALGIEKLFKWLR